MKRDFRSQNESAKKFTRVGRACFRPSKSSGNFAGANSRVVRIRMIPNYTNRMTGVDCQGMEEDVTLDSDFS